MNAKNTLLFPWKPEYCTGHVGIDGQHQKLAQFVNQLFAAMSTGQGREMTDRILVGLADYTKTHFEFEEKQMERFSYPDLPEHRRLHRQLLGQVDAYVRKAKAGQQVNAIELSHFLKAWLLHHIGQEDRELAQYLNNKN